MAAALAAAALRSSLVASASLAAAALRSSQAAAALRSHALAAAALAAPKKSLFHPFYNPDWQVHFNMRPAPALAHFNMRPACTGTLQPALAHFNLHWQKVSHTYLLL
jgi:hypothetical protein